MTLGYYPFGLKQKGYNDVINGGNDLAQNWKFGGKELSEEFGLNTYDFGVRSYDASLGRWFNTDPLTDFKPDQTPYRYGFNNPIGYTDPSGLYEIGIVSLTDDEKKALREEHGKGKEYRKARRAKLNEKEEAVKSAISDLKDFLDNNSEVSQIFQDFSGFKEGTDDWDNLWTDNGRGFTINISGKTDETTGGYVSNGGKMTLNSGNSHLGNLETVLHEYVHMGDMRRKEGYDGTKNGLPGYDAQAQRSSIEGRMKHLQSIDSNMFNNDMWLEKYGPTSGYPILNNKGKAVNVELGYGFEKAAFGSANPDYSTIFAQYLKNKK